MTGKARLLCSGLCNHKNCLSITGPGAISSTDAEVVVEVDAAEKIMAKIHLQNSYVSRNGY